jgi:uncharacterized membrane protein YqaE (UPF0057 family)
VLTSATVPPAGVAIVAGCGVDLAINILLTILGYIPGHIHAFYLEFVYYERREAALAGQLPPTRAPGVYSNRVQRGGLHGASVGYGTIPPQGAYAPPPGAGPHQGY